MGERQLPPVPSTHRPNETRCKLGDGKHRYEEVVRTGQDQLQPRQDWMNTVAADDERAQWWFTTRFGAVQAVISQSPGGMESRSLLVPYPAAPSQSDQHALYRDMESRWAVNPKVRPGDHTFLMVK